MKAANRAFSLPCNFSWRGRSRNYKISDMSAVLDFIESKPEKQRGILLFIHDLMLSYDGITSKIRYRIPFYYKNSWVCYANPKNEDSVELVFLRANEFPDPSGLLESRGRKQVAGIIIKELEFIPDQLSDVIEEALRLDETKKYNSKRIL